MDDRALARLISLAKGLQRPGETQEELSARIGIKRSKWLGWTTGRKPNGDGFWELAEALGWPVEKLMAHLEGRDLHVGGDRTWADVARQLIDDPVALASFAAELDDRELTRLSLALLTFHQERNG